MSSSGARSYLFAEAVRLVHQALRGLQHIHEQGMIHRDLKPGNLMLVPPRPPGGPDNTLHSTVKVLDIGVGRILFDENVKGDGQDQMVLTTAGMMLGSATYTSPEQSRNAHAADIRADIYSLGCVLYHCLAGKPPFSGADDFDIILRHFTEPPRPIRELRAVGSRGVAGRPEYLPGQGPEAALWHAGAGGSGTQAFPGGSRATGRTSQLANPVVPQVGRDAARRRGRIAHPRRPSAGTTAGTG